ncbi:MAG TPA: DNA recombination protein RmuC [Bacteroidia bacterium]|nr:DNA recombination protein RmuC [Bacteroidia bacterium]HMU18527.1 DNA recombination protein RmuC [Bacteroidia bacterium]
MTVYLILTAVISAVVVYFIVQQKLNAEIRSIKQLLSEKEIAVGSMQVSLHEAKSRILEAENLFSQERDSMLKLTAQHAALNTKNTDLQEKLNAQKTEIEQLQQRFKTEFENLANKILEEKSIKFTEQNRINLDLVLNPLKEKIKDFEDKVEKTYKTESSERISLKEQIKNLLDLNKQLSSEANNLATALKGDNKMQGNWGELVLEKILESSGLIKDQEYRTQVVTTNVEGDRIKPDVMVFLPEQKHLIIDSKVSLVAYSQMISSTDDTERSKATALHIQSVKNHIKLLSEKSYQTAAGYNTPDFVLLFMPIEPAFSVVMQADPEIYQFAWDKKIVIVSPTTLLATLRTVASIWKQERQVKNALLIAEEGGKMYDKLVLFIADMISIGKKMDGAKEDYVEAMKKLTDGSGNLIGKAQKMKELGAKAQKSLPQSLIERAGE